MAVKLQYILLWCGTFPYFWTLIHFTLKPIQVIKDLQNASRDLMHAMMNFRFAKERELIFVKVASTLSAAATLGVLSWPPVQGAPWQALGLWYSSLILAIFALVTAAQHSALLNTIPACLHGCIAEGCPKALACFLKTTEQDIETRKSTAFPISYNMVFIWQFPLMLMSWSWTTFVLALTLHIASPLCESLQNTDTKPAAIFYLSTCGLSCMAFAWCSFHVYEAAARTGVSMEHDCNACHSCESNKTQTSFSFREWERMVSHKSSDVEAAAAQTTPETAPHK